MAIRSIGDLRAQAGQDWADSTDEDLIAAYSKSINLDPASVANQLGYKAEASSKTSNRFGAAIDQYQAGLYGLGEAVTGALGFEGASESLAERRRANELEAGVYSLRAREQGAIESYKDVGGVRDAADYVAGLAIQSAPYLAESLVGGIAGRAVMGGTKAALRTAIEAGDDVAAAAARQSLNRGATMGAVASGYPSAVSDVLGSQREQAGETDLGSAAALGVPYAALNAFGVEGALARREGFRNTMNLLDNVSGIKGGVARAAATGTRIGAVEGLSETAQEGLNQFGRMVVDPNEAFLTPESKERFAESFVGGAALGGVGGAAFGGYRRTQAGSMLKDVNNVGPQGGTETNAINSAIDQNSPEFIGPRTEQFGPPEPVGPRQPYSGTPIQVTPSGDALVTPAQQEAYVNFGRTQLEQKQQAEAQQKAQQDAVNTQRQKVLDKYGAETIIPGDTEGHWKFLGKDYFNRADYIKAIDNVVKQEAGKNELTLNLEDALQQGGNKLAPGALRTMAAGLAGQTPEKTLYNINAKIASLAAKGKDVTNPELSRLASAYETLTGQEAPAYSTVAKGKQDERLQLQSNAGVRAVSEQGGTAQRDGSRPGVLQPSSVQPVQPGSVAQGQTSQQVGQPAASGVRISPVVSTTGGPSVQSGQDALQGKGQGQVNEQGQIQTTDQEGRDSVPGQDVEGSRTAAEEAQDRAESVVSEVVNSIIEAIVKRTGRMSAKNLASLKEFMYYDFFQVASKEKEGLSVKELADMYKVSSDTIDGWRKIAGKFFDENRGVIQAKILEGIAAQGTTLEQLKLDLQAVRNAKQNDVVVLEEAEALITGKGEKLSKDETEIEEAAKGELEGFKLDADESTLDQRDLGSETGGMSVSTGRVQQSIQEQDKPEETINARIERKLEEYNKAVENGDEAKEAKLMAEIDELTKEAKKVDTKRVAKAAAIAEDKAPKKKEPKERKKRAVQKPSAEKVPVREGTGSSEGVRKEDTEKRKAAAEGKTDEEAGEAAWNEGIKDFPEAPKFKELSEEQQKDWINFGPDNWTKDDVQTELIKLSKEMKVPAKSMQESFSENNPLIDPLSEEVDAALRGKNIKEALQWAQKNVRNEYERLILGSIEARLRELMNLGVEFSFSLTAPGKQLVGGMLGVSTISPAGLGSAQKVDVVLNGAHTGAKAGTNYETLVHELIHAVTQAQLRIAPDGTAAKELKALYNEIIRQFNTRAKAGKLTPFEQKFFRRENNSLEDADELLAWGLTNKEFQEYLASIIVAPKVTLWNKFVRAIGKLLGSPVSTDSALGQLLSISENLLTESMTPYVTEANKRFQSLGKQPNPTQWPNWSINPELGAPVWVEGDYVLYQASSANGGVLFVPGSRAGDTSATARVDVSQFSGKQIPALVLAQMKVVADGMRPKSSASINTARQTVGLNRLRKNGQFRINRLPPTIKPLVRAIWDALFSIKETVLGVMISADVYDLAKKYMPSVAKYIEVDYLRTEIDTAFTEKLDKIMLSAEQDLNEKQRAEVNRLLEDSTISGKWAYDPRIEGAIIDEGLKQRFNAMNAAQQKVVKDVFEYFREVLQAKKDAINTLVDSKFAKDMEAATTDKERKQVERSKRAMLKQFSSLMEMNKNTPYAPIKRFGSFVVVAKSKEFVEAEEAGDTARVNELKADEKHYVVDFAETLGEAQEMYENLDDTGIYAQVQEPFKRSESKEQLFTGADLYKGFAKLKKIVAEKKELDGGTAALDRIQSMVNELYLLSLAESSARKSELQRRGVAGVNRATGELEARDMLRAAFTQGTADAKYIAGIRTNDAALEAMIEMQKEAAGNRKEAYPYLNEIMAREAQALQIRDRSLLDAANRMTGNWFLTFSPSFYFQQATQTLVLSHPWLAGKYGSGKSLAKIYDAYKDIMPLVKGTNLRDHIDFSKAPADVREMLDVMVRRGRINIGVDSELYNYRSTSSNPVTQTYDKVTNKLRGTINRIEALNRSVAAIAAYRLEMAKPGGTKESALKAADDVIRATHGLYDGSNTPRLFNKNAVTRSITQFRRFQIIQLTMLTKMMHDMFKNADPLERAIARKQFAFLMAHTFALAGVKGVPLYGLASLVYSGMMAAFGDENDPEDFEAWLRSKGGLLLARGIPAEFGVDVSGKLGLGNVMSILPYTDIDLTSKGGLEKLALGVMGPFASGILPKMADGIGLVAGGDYYKGLEQMMPKGIGDAMKGARFTTEGITKRNGDIVMSPDEISFAEGFMKAVGLPTTNISEQQYLQSMVYDYDKFFAERAKSVKSDYVKATRNGDTEARGEAREAWQKLQEARAKQGYKKQPMSDLLKAPQDAKKREKTVIGGVQTTRGNRKFVKQLSEQE